MKVLRSLVLSAALLFGGIAHASEKYAVAVMDADKNEVIYSENGDQPRIPASLTKMMTLYLVFESLDSGRISMQTKLKVSKYASRQSPTKLGLKPGSTITVQSAVLSLITQSANDSAVTIAENLGGSERTFALKMTAKAKELGMNNTYFYNASGLPNANQRTTAIDLAILSDHLVDDFPLYYSLFSTEAMSWGKRYIRNHNHLLGAVDGVDGIKTGYTNASGYNLAASAVRNNRRLIVIFIGGVTSSDRDEQVEYLLNEYFAQLEPTTGELVMKKTSPISPIKPLDSLSLK